MVCIDQTLNAGRKDHVSNDIRLKRVYEHVEQADGVRILVDRLWPRGIAKEDERIDKWYKTIAPSHALRKWFHQHGDFDAFSERYRRELLEGEEGSAALRKLTQFIKETQQVTLVYASKNSTQNNAVLLKRIL